MQANGQLACTNNAALDALLSKMHVHAPLKRSSAFACRCCTGPVPSMCTCVGVQEDAHQEAVRGLQLEAAKQVSKLRQEVEAGARGLAGRAGAAWLQACSTLCVYSAGELFCWHAPAGAAAGHAAVHPKSCALAELSVG